MGPRISIQGGSDIRTYTGIGLGSNLQAVRAVYGHDLDEPFDHLPIDGDAVLVRACANRYLVNGPSRLAVLPGRRWGLSPLTRAPND